MIRTLALSVPDTPSAYLAAQTLGGFFQRRRHLPGIIVPLILSLTGCAAGSPTLPYPAFVQADELPDVFVAGMPGIRAKAFVDDPETRRSSHRLQLPAGWKGTIGASPSKVVELFVIVGDVTLGRTALQAGGYAYIPPPFTGSDMKTASGAAVLFFLDDPHPAAVIRTPIIMDSRIVDWQAVSDNPDDEGISVKTLRLDPGSGARTWLRRIEPGATQGWRVSSTGEEGYLLAGDYRHSECIDGEVRTDDYAPGGYFHRPAGAVNGGPDATAASTAIWLLRRREDDRAQEVPDCRAN